MQDANSILAGISTIVAIVAGISVATERVVEVIKGAVPQLATPWTKNDGIRAAILQVMATAAGAVIASQIPASARTTLPFGLSADLHWQGYILIGLMASGGSGAWNQVLDILGALKTKQTTAAQTIAAGAAQAAAVAKGAGA